jgi:hypothetical protein
VSLRDEVRDRLAALEERVGAAVAYRQHCDEGLDDPLRPLVVTSRDVDRLLVEGEGFSFPATPSPPLDGPELTAFTERADLDAVDIDLLLLAAAPDVDPRFERFYGYLNDDVTLRRATAGLALRICGLELDDPAARRRLEPASALLSQGLLVVDDVERPFTTRSLRVPDRVTTALLGDDGHAPEVAPLLRSPLPFGNLLQDVLGRAIDAGLPLVYVDERTGAVRHVVAGALESLGIPTVLIDLQRVRMPDVVELCRAVRRDALFSGRLLVAGPIDVIVDADPAALPALVHGNQPVVLTGTRRWEPEWLADIPLLVESDLTGSDMRAELWAYALGDDDAALDPARSMAPFRLDADQILRATLAARRRAVAEGRPLGVPDLQAGARSQSSPGLARLSRRIDPVARWEQLVLPPEPLAGLREITARLRHRRRVLDEWGLRRGGGRGEGCTALFAGPSGTGKTMAAEVIGRELGLDLFTVDLATVIDKYIGETEKNLDRIFGEAERVNGVLFFDEADALFGKRSEVKDSHDRHANTEVAYLLQRMERFDGLAVLATNLKANLDEAFARRLDVVVDFPEPDVEHRLRLWRLCLSPPLPLADDVDLDFCALRFRLTGGHIRNIAVTASYLAAERGSAVTMIDLIRAVQREYRKLGRLCGEDEFGPYVSILAAGERSPV